MEILFLTVDEILDIHEDQIERYGGNQAVRDMGLLESAVAQPSAGMGEEYFHSDVYSMAAAYLFHITQNHPFVDGNKRTGVVAADVFLAINGIIFVPDNEEFEALVFDVSSGKLGKQAVAEYIRNNCRV